MSVVTGSWLVDGLLLVATLLYLLYWLLSRNNNYFKDRGIPYIKPTPFMGSWDMFTKSQYDFSIKLYNTFRDERFFGYFQSKVPCLVVNDPNLIQKIMVKDFAYFHDRGFPSSEHDPLQMNLFNLKGQHWRALRQKLIPTFSTGKLKKMFDQLLQCADHLMEDVEETSQTQEPIDAKDIINKMTIEVIGCTTFGLDLGRNKPQTKEFMEKIKVVFNGGFREYFLFFLQLVAPKLLVYFDIWSLPRDVYDYFYNLTTATKEYRKKNNIKRNDYFQLLLSLQEAEENGSCSAVENTEDDALVNQMEHAPQYSQTELPARMFRDQDLTAQSFIFLVAGTDSINTTVSFALYHIAKNPTVETRLKQDIHRALKKHGGWTYEAVKDMTYIDQVIQETQRMYPVVTLHARECTIPYAIPDTNIVLEKGTMVNIAVAGLQMDPRYYPNPEVFNPERFAENAHRPSATFMPFGDGPRVCIAMRFAILEMKICLAKIFNNFSVVVNSKTKEPFTFDSKSFFPTPVGGIWINFKKSPQIAA